MIRILMLFSYLTFSSRCNQHIPTARMCGFSCTLDERNIEKPSMALVRFKLRGCCSSVLETTYHYHKPAPPSLSTSSSSPSSSSSSSSSYSSSSSSYSSQHMTLWQHINQTCSLKPNWQVLSFTVAPMMWAQHDIRSMLQWSQLSMSIPNEPIFLSSLSAQIAPQKQNWTTCQSSSHRVLNNTSAFQSSSLGKVQLPIFPIWLRKDSAPGCDAEAPASWTASLGIGRCEVEWQMDSLTATARMKKIRAKYIARNSLRCTASREFVFFLEGQIEVPHWVRAQPKWAATQARVDVWCTNVPRQSTGRLTQQEDTRWSCCPLMSRYYDFQLWMHTSYLHIEYVWICIPWYRLMT